MSSRDDLAQADRDEVLEGGCDDCYGGSHRRGSVGSGGGRGEFASPSYPLSPPFYHPCFPPPPSPQDHPKITRQRGRKTRLQSGIFVQQHKTSQGGVGVHRKRETGPPLAGLLVSGDFERGARRLTSVVRPPGACARPGVTAWRPAPPRKRPGRGRSGCGVRAGAPGLAMARHGALAPGVSHVEGPAEGPSRPRRPVRGSMATMLELSSLSAAARSAPPDGQRLPSTRSADDCRPARGRAQPSRLNSQNPPTSSKPIRA